MQYSLVSQGPGDKSFVVAQTGGKKTVLKVRPLHLASPSAKVPKDPEGFRILLSV